METYDIQKQFFQQLKAQLPGHVSMVEEVADLLGISTDSAYRRIRGEKPISMEELQKLCNHFHVSVDKLMNIESDGVLFNGSFADSVNFDFESYLKDSLLNLKLINKADKKLLYYDSKDIPLFHHYQIPDLATFKFFFWMRTILSYPEYNEVSFEDVKLPAVLYHTGIEIIKTYNRIPSIEIWTFETLNSTLRQIEYYKESGVFKKKESVMNLYNQVERLIHHIKAQAECGKKFLIGEQPRSNENNYQLFFNEVTAGHNTLMAEMDGRIMVFINHGVLNYMITRDEKFCAFTKKSLENTMHKSALISSVSEKERNRFFKVLLEKIERQKEDLDRGGF